MIEHNMTEQHERLLEILKDKTEIDPETGCYLYTGSKNNDGYGQIQFEHMTMRTHKIGIYLQLNLDPMLPYGPQVNHKCSNKHCWNPEHVYIGDQQENHSDAMRARTHTSIQSKSKTHCPNGHEYTEDNTHIDKRGCRRCRKCNAERYLPVKFRTNYGQKKSQ